MVGVLDALALFPTVLSSYEQPLSLLAIFHNPLAHDGEKYKKREWHVTVVDFFSVTHPYKWEHLTLVSNCGKEKYWRRSANKGQESKKNP